MVEGFVDPDWGGTTDDYVFILGGGAVSWATKKQRTVALSSKETEYMALSAAAKEAIHLHR